MLVNRGLAVDISIFIPVYKESNQLASMLHELSAQNVAKEIFVTVDEPTDEFSQKIKELQLENVKFIINESKCAKQHNEAVFRQSAAFLRRRRSNK
jgi:cellulose synthase/poly-beta-1,6-N-acetylglucosamine synthase-like glycosyltransferase